MLLARYSIILSVLLVVLGCDNSNVIDGVWKKNFSDSKLTDSSGSNVGYNSALLLGRRRISKYDRIIKKHSRRYGFDWRLISAQIFAESGYKENAKSRVGALGLMQIMPSTAKHMGVDASLLLNPERNISLGCYYNYWLYSLWKEKSGEERLKFTFASYNAGRGRILRCQKKNNVTDWELLKKFVPRETKMYVEKIFMKYDNYCKTFY